MFIIRFLFIVMLLCLTMVTNIQQYLRSTVVPLLIIPGPAWPSSAVARNFKLVIDSENSDTPTPINTAYLKAINSTREGDDILTFQKYFRNEEINNALISAASRKVKVTGIYRDELEPSCSSLQLNKSILCNEIFIQSPLPHHKNMMVQYANGIVHAFIGSYNLHERSPSEPRIHTILEFEIYNGHSIFDYYSGEADRLLGLSTTQSKSVSIDIDGGGTLQLQMHPSNAHPVLDMLNAITTFESTLWVSFYGAANDNIGKPVYERLQALNDAGCDVRVLLHTDNFEARNALENRGVPVHFPEYKVDKALLGHKLLMMRSGGDLHLIQSSANLSESHYNTQHNLTLYLRAPGMIKIQTELEVELNRYWK